MLLSPSGAGPDADPTTLARVVDAALAQRFAFGGAAAPPGRPTPTARPGQRIGAARIAEGQGAGAVEAAFRIRATMSPALGRVVDGPTPASVARIDRDRAPAIGSEAALIARGRRRRRGWRRRRRCRCGLARGAGPDSDPAALARVEPAALAQRFAFGGESSRAGRPTVAAIEGPRRGVGATGIAEHQGPVTLIAALRVRPRTRNRPAGPIDGPTPTSRPRVDCDGAPAIRLKALGTCDLRLDWYERKREQEKH